MKIEVTETLTPVHRGANVDTSLVYMGNIMSFLVNGYDTRGAFGLVAAHARQGSEPPPHIHHREHELWYILEGEVEFFCEGVEHSIRVCRGEVILLPKAKAHAVIYHSSEVRVLLIGYAGSSEHVAFDTYFREMASGPATDMQLPGNSTTYATATELQAFNEIAERNGFSLLSPEEAAQRLPSYPGFG